MIVDQDQIQFLAFSLLWIPQAFIYLSDSQQENCMNFKYISLFTFYDVWSLVILRADMKFGKSTKFWGQPPTKLSEEFLEWRFSRFPTYYGLEKLINNADSLGPSSEILIQEIWRRDPEIWILNLHIWWQEYRWYKDNVLITLAWRLYS